MTKHPRIRRRAFLQATGVSISLPWLESNAYADPTDQPKRMLLISNNLGVLPRHFFPKDSGPEYTPSPYLQQYICGVRLFAVDLAIGIIYLNRANRPVRVQQDG